MPDTSEQKQWGLNGTVVCVLLIPKDVCFHSTEHGDRKISAGHLKFINNRKWGKKDEDQVIQILFTYTYYYRL